MNAGDVTDTLEMALSASGLDRKDVRYRPRLLSDNGSSYVAGDLADWMSEHDMSHIRGAPYHPMTQGKIERWHQTLKNRILLEHYYLPGDLEAQIDAVRRPLQSSPLPRKPRQSHACRRLLRPRPDHPIEQRKDQTKNTRTTPLATRKASRLNQPNR
jgi:transposase InsO family protein